MQAAAHVAQQLGAAEHRIVRFDLRTFGGSALTSDLAVPKDRDESQMSDGGIPITYVPARNTIFLSFALAYAEVTAADAIFIGVNALDYSGYPDCRPEFISAFEAMANLATRAGVEGTTYLRIHAPLMKMTKAEIVKEALKLGVDLKLTHSCYDPAPDGRACGRCDSCILRRKGFEEAGVVDPLAVP
jgi:7-cyano-7-deazaguanine synthase